MAVLLRAKLGVSTAALPDAPSRRYRSFEPREALVERRGEWREAITVVTVVTVAAGLGCLPLLDAVARKDHLEKRGVF